MSLVFGAHLSDDEFGELVIALEKITIVPPDKLASLVGAWLDASPREPADEARQNLATALGVILKDAWTDGGTDSSDRCLSPKQRSKLNQLHQRLTESGS